MNYKSQLKGWSVDRVIEIARANVNSGALVTVEDVMKQADQLAAYAYVPEEDLKTTANALFDLLRRAPAGAANIDILLAALEDIKADREREGLDNPSVNAN